MSSIQSKVIDRKERKNFRKGKYFGLGCVGLFAGVLVLYAVIYNVFIAHDIDYLFIIMGLLLSLLAIHGSISSIKYALKGEPKPPTPCPYCGKELVVPRKCVYCGRKVKKRWL